MTADTINDLFYIVGHYDSSTTLGDGSTTVDTMLQTQYCEAAGKIYNTITDEDLTLSGGPTAFTFGTDKYFENQVTAYIAVYLCEIDMHPKEHMQGESAIWTSRFMQMALQLINSIYPDKVEARPIGGQGLVWLIKAEKRHNISVVLGTMRSNYNRSGQPQSNIPSDSDEMYGR